MTAIETDGSDLGDIPPFLDRRIKKPDPTSVFSQVPKPEPVAYNPAPTDPDIAKMVDEGCPHCGEDE